MLGIFVVDLIADRAAIHPVEIACIEDLIAVLIGGQPLGEGSTGRRLLAAGVMFAGIVVLATG